MREKANIQATNDDEQAPLLLAAENGHTQVIKLLVNKAADLNAQSEYYGNALQADSSGCNEAVVKLLVARGANSS